MLFLKADNFQMICSIDKTCQLRAWVWCRAGEYAGPFLTDRALVGGHDGRLVFLAGGRCRGSRRVQELSLVGKGSCCLGSHNTLSPSVERRHLLTFLTYGNGVQKIDDNAIKIHTDLGSALEKFELKGKSPTVSSQHRNLWAINSGY